MFQLFCPCIVNDYNLLVPTNAHNILICIAPYWLLHVSADYELPEEVPGKVKCILV